jgi:sigma-B regulation protein RsbU (phosphoserine phosphatase)
MIRKLQLLLLLLASFLCGFAPAQSFEVLDGNLRVTSLDGLWRFHTGDDPAWASPTFDDSHWPLLRSDRDWAQQGYQGYSGLAWYRFRVTIPAGLDHVALLLPTIRTCYEAFADGQLIGTYGKMPPNDIGYVGGGSQVFELSAGDQRQRTVEIALRVWQFPGWAAYQGGGAASAGGLIGEATQIERRRSLLQTQSFWDSAADEFIAVLQALAGLGALALFLFRRKEREYLWFGLAMLFSSAGNWFDLSYLSHVWNIVTRNRLGDIFQTGAWLAVPFFYWELLKPRRSWFLNISLALLVVSFVDNYFYLAAAIIPNIWAVNLFALLCGIPINVWILVVLIAKAREGSPDARLLLLPQIPYSASFLISTTTLITYQLGWQHSFIKDIPLTTRPFPITLQNVADLLFPLAVFGILVLRFTRTRGEEERFASEFASARSVQQFLIPEQLPATPGLAIESEYRPAKEVGGDFFQIIPDEKDGSALIVVGDVAGHGLKSGMLATMVIGAIRSTSTFTNEPQQVLAHLNEQLLGRGLVTALALRIERDGSSTLANAGHLPPYLNGQELAIEGALPLGAAAGTEIPTFHFKLSQDDKLILMTDGVPEAQNAEGQLFGFDRISDMLRKGVAASALATAAQEFGQEDDITVLTLSYVAVQASA